MRKVTKIKILILLKNFLFFIFLIIFPIFVLSIVRAALEKFRIFINENLFWATINYSMFFALFLLLRSFKRKEVDYISNENWFYSFGRALTPSIMAFGIGFLATFGFIFISDLFPLSQGVKEWISLPNQGYVEVFKEVKNNNAFFMLLWFFYIVVAAPLSEEIIFRGALQKFAERIIKKWDLDCIFVAFIFSLFHINSLSNAIFSFVVGFFLSKIRKDSGSINVSVWIHGVINFMGLLYGIIFQYKS
ncbi:MAG TPA: type II CAAX endopeptidase family protein [Spirochaetota bacterium]|nr:type II CAAX endopeptidase family protein [Spirochaetota bacterium]